MSQRPAGDKDYRLALRITRGVYTAADGARRFDTSAGTIVAEVIHGSTSFDAGVGHERFSSNGPGAGRWYVSAGVRRKAGMWRDDGSGNMQPRSSQLADFKRSGQVRVSFEMRSWKKL